MKVKNAITYILFILSGLPLSGQSGDTIHNPRPQKVRFTSGGEFRSRLRMFKAINYGDVTPPQNDYDTYLNLRGIVFGSLEVGENITLYSEILSGYTLFKDNTSASDQDLMGMSQVYGEARLPSLSAGIRLGRQELDFGSGKILGTSDGPNVATNFDGFRLTYSGKTFTGDLLAVRPVHLEPGFLDNTVGTDNLIYGAYLTFPAGKQTKLDLYAFGNKRDQIIFEDQVANERRYTMGGRISREEGAVSYEAEFAGQTGTFGNSSISAFYLSGMAGYNWDSRMKPSFLIRGALYSGKKDSTDQHIKFFRPVYSRPPVNSMSPIGSSNIFMLVPQLDLEIFKNVLVSARYFMIWRYSSEDGLYTTRLEGMSRAPDTPGNEKGRFVTNGLITQIEYTINNHFEIDLTTGWFFAGDYIRNTGHGKNVQATFLIGYFRF